MGFSELWLVAPRDFDRSEARRMAHGAVDVLDRARVADSLDAALADCRWVVGTTRRAGRRRTATLTPRRFAELARMEPRRRPLAVVFGPEEDGLSMAELARCNDVVRVPTSAAQPSLNLGQAVLLLAYELRFARLGSRQDGDSEAGAEASAGVLEQFYAHAEAALLAVGFVRPDTAPHRMLALRKLLGRARPRPGEVRLLRGICRQVLWAVGRAPARAHGGRRRGTPV
jgi:TrmH family RNA methyltransferase